MRDSTNKWSFKIDKPAALGCILNLRVSALRWGKVPVSAPGAGRVATRLLQFAAFTLKVETGAVVVLFYDTSCYFRPFRQY